MLPAFLALLVLQLIGELLVQSLGLPLPGPLVGMLLLLAALVWRGEVPDGLKQVGDALLQNLVLLFVPAVTGVMMLFERVGREWWPLLAGGVGGAALTIVVTAFALRWALAREHRAGDGDGGDAGVGATPVRDDGAAR